VERERPELCQPLGLGSSADGRSCRSRARWAGWASRAGNSST